MNFDPVKVVFWTKHLQDWSVSGTSLIAYCRCQGIGYSTFYAWRKRLASIAADPVVVATSVATAIEPVVAAQVKLASTAKMPNVVTKKAHQPVQLVPVSVGICVKIPGIVLRSPAGWQVNLSDHIDLSSLAQLLRDMP